MRELEPVGVHRVFVYEPGDTLAICRNCGTQRYVDNSLINNPALQTEMEMMFPSHCQDSVWELRTIDVEGEK